MKVHIDVTTDKLVSDFQGLCREVQVRRRDSEIVALSCGTGHNHRKCPHRQDTCFGT